MQSADSVPVSYECASFSHWRDAVCATFVDLDCKRPNPEKFWGKIERRKLFDMAFVDVSALEHSAIRDKGRIARSDDDFYLLSLLHRGEMTIVQRGRTARLGPGDFAIYDTSEAYQIHLDQPFAQTVLKIKRKDISDRLLNASSLTARRVAGDTGIGHLASHFVRELRTQLDNIYPPSAHQLRMTLLDLVSGALKELGGDATPPAREGQTLLLHRILQFVEDNLHDENLSCETVAQSLGVSGRYLRKLFEGRSHSLSEWIWHRRLEEAHRSLTDIQSAQRSVTAIAYDLGFKDPAHFSKAFRTRFGLTPRECRHLSTADRSYGQAMPLRTRS